ncbi:MAG: ArsR family transcriptional regulator [Rhodobacter sp.]|nr:ArsR family transcriptional regulator [Rhodobacter sp.]
MSHPRRVLILHTLLSNPAAGDSFGALARDTKLASSTLEHHLRVLLNTGTIQRSQK